MNFFFLLKIHNMAFYIYQKSSKRKILFLLNTIRKDGKKR